MDSVCGSPQEFCSLFSDVLASDISYTVAPSSIQKFPGADNDPHAHFWSVATLTFPSARQENMGTPQSSVLHQASLRPDEHLACFDYLYYVCASTVRVLIPSSIFLFFSQLRSPLNMDLITAQPGDSLSQISDGRNACRG